MRAVVVGATGAHGRRVASELTRHEAVDGVRLVARSVDALEHLASVLGGPARNVSCAAADIAGPRPADIFDGAGVVVSCSAADHAACASAAIAARVACVTLGEDALGWHRLRALDSGARDAGVTVAAGCGFSPGITNLLERLACAELERVDSITLTVARSLADTEGRASLLALLELFGTSDERAAFDPGHLPRLAYFPEPIGWVETFAAAHPETDSAAPGPLHFRIGLTEGVATDLARAAAALRVSRTPVARTMWLRLAASIRPVVSVLPARAAPWTGARVDAHGDRGGRATTVTLGLVDHLANLVPLMAAGAALQLGTGTIVEPGVHSPEELFDARAVLASLADRGIRVARLEPEPV